jgi:peptide deformylase
VSFPWRHYTTQHDLPAVDPSARPAGRHHKVTDMAIHPIRIVGDPVLRTPARPGTTFDHALRRLVDDLFATNTAANGAGLAANQIGVDLRVFVYDLTDDGVHSRGAVVNPTIETSTVPQTMPDPDDDWEGCLSVPGESFPTARADWARITGFDADGQPVEVEGTGFLARCFQHETDHLDGVLYLDRLVGRHARDAKRMLRHRRWGGPGLSWDPATEPDPFG